MAENKYLNTVIQIGLSFLFGFLFIVFLIIGGSIFVGKDIKKSINDKQSLSKIPMLAYTGSTYSFRYPENYQLSEDKIVATDGIIIEQEDTIHLISPTLQDSEGNLSMIITFKPLKGYQEEDTKGSTCPELNEKKLDEIIIGTQTFTTSGQIFCGPNEVSFFYILNNKNIYEIKVETTADYEIFALPEVLKILKTLRFKE